MGINEAAMREPMRRQSAHDRKHSSEQKSATLVATLAAESDEQVRAVVDCIVDQIEASAGAERDRALAAAAGGDDMELERDEPAAPSLPTWGAERDAEGALLYFRTATGVASYQIESQIRYEPVQLNSLARDDCIEVFREKKASSTILRIGPSRRAAGEREGSWLTAFVGYVDDEEDEGDPYILAYFEKAQKWSTLEA
eukprot:COSAG04_NODE_13721_length_594_cov_1.145455_1_plen_197_part_11